MAKSKEEIVKTYEGLRRKLGRPPKSLKEFRDATRIHQSILARYFGRNAFTTLVKECGDFRSPDLRWLHRACGKHRN